MWGKRPISSVHVRKYCKEIVRKKVLKFPHIFPHILLLPIFLTIFLTFTFLTFSLHFSSHLPCEESGQFPALMWGNFCEEKVWKMWGNSVENVRKFPHFFLTFSSHWIFIVIGWVHSSTSSISSTTSISVGMTIYNWWNSKVLGCPGFAAS